MFKLLKYFGEIVKLYLYLVICFYLFYKLISINFIFIYILLICFMIALFKDDRIKGVRFVIFMLILIIHLIILNEGGYETEVLIIKDLFWYSLLMMSSFIGHVLILNWLYKLSEYIKGDYGCYVVSRGSLLTSLTILLGIVLWFEKLFMDFDILGLVMKRYKLKDNKIYSFCDFRYLNKAIFIMFILIIVYFSKSFQNYTKLLLGLSKKIEFSKIPIKFYIYFILTFVLSILLMTPRIYLIGELIIIGKISLIVKDSVNDGYRHKELYLKGECTLFSFFSERLYINLDYDRSKRFLGFPGLFGDDSFRDVLTDDWKLIYEEGLIKEFIYYTSCPDGYVSGTSSEAGVSNYLEILKLFVYSRDRYKKLLIRLFEGYAVTGDMVGEGKFIGVLNKFNEDFLKEESKYLTVEDVLGDYRIEGEIVIEAEKGVKTSVDLGISSRMKFKNDEEGHCNVILQDKALRFY